MPRIARVAAGNTIYHVINRANEKARIFNSDDEYKHFETLLAEGKELFDVRILAYCIMPNHGSQAVSNTIDLYSDLYTFIFEHLKLNFPVKQTEREETEKRMRKFAEG